MGITLIITLVLVLPPIPNAAKLNYIMTHRVKRPIPQWVGVPTREMCEQTGTSTDYLKKGRARGLFVKGVHYYTLPGSERIIWVKDLVRDLMVNGANSPAHQRAIEKYLASFPSSREYKSTAA